MKKIVILAAVLIVLFAFGCTDVPTPYEGSDNNSQGDGMSVADNSSVINDKNGSNQIDNLGDFMGVKAGDTVSVHYVGKKQNGEIFDSSIGKSPLTFEAGAGQMIKGFDQGVIGMNVGETKTITIPPEEGYGVINEDNKQTIMKDQIGLDSYEVGQVEIIGQYRLKFYEVNDDNVVASVNHFLSGETLIFEVTLVSIQ